MKIHGAGAQRRGLRESTHDKHKEPLWMLPPLQEDTQRLSCKRSPVATHKEKLTTSSSLPAIEKNMSFLSEALPPVRKDRERRQKFMEEPVHDSHPRAPAAWSTRDLWRSSQGKGELSPVALSKHGNGSAAAAARAESNPSLLRMRPECSPPDVRLAMRSPAARHRAIRLQPLEPLRHSAPSRLEVDEKAPGAAAERAEQSLNAGEVYRRGALPFGAPLAGLAVEHPDLATRTSQDLRSPHRPALRPALRRPQRHRPASLGAVPGAKLPPQSPKDEAVLSARTPKLQSADQGPASPPGDAASSEAATSAAEDASALPLDEAAARRHAIAEMRRLFDEEMAQSASGSQKISPNAAAANALRRLAEGSRSSAANRSRSAPCGPARAPPSNR
mmetsp:Transcript_98721/g.172442  ORF Transcript_98721/g.172442 Transcript_98721/m.172442 type:complete len:389 (-) Transcript_98721:69-1235(-)